MGRGEGSILACEREVEDGLERIELVPERVHLANNLVQRECPPPSPKPILDVEALLRDGCGPAEDNLG